MVLDRGLLYTADQCNFLRARGRMGPKYELVYIHSAVESVRESESLHNKINIKRFVSVKWEPESFLFVSTHPLHNGT